MISDDHHDEKYRAMRDAHLYASWNDYARTRPTLQRLTAAEVAGARQAFERHRTVEGYLTDEPDRI